MGRLGVLLLANRRMARKSSNNSARTLSAAARAASGSDVHSNSQTSVLGESLDALFLGVGQKLREGKSSEAEASLTHAIDTFRLDPEELANLRRLLAFTYETVGRYKESLDIIKPYEDEDVLSQLSNDTQVRISTQLAISFNNLGDHPKAVTLLKSTLETAKANDLDHLMGNK